MKKTQLIAVLKTFDKKEHKLFTKWLISPFFNQRKDVQVLYQYLAKPNHLIEDKFLEKERVFRKVFPKEGFDDAKLRQTVHFLLKHVEDFLVYQQQKEDLLSQNLTITKIYRQRKLSPLFLHQMNKTKKLFSKTKEKSTHFYRLQYELVDESASFIKEQLKKANVDINESIDALDTYIMTKKLKQACLIISHQKVFKSESRIRFIDTIVHLLEKNDVLTIEPLTLSYYHIYLMQVHENSIKAEKHYFSLKEILKEKLLTFHKIERQDIYLMALNFCIHKMNAGYQQFIREAFEMYKKGISDQIFIQEGILSSYTYLNISSIALRLKEYEWTREFIDKYSSYLDKQHQSNFKQYTLARLYFEQKQHKEARTLLVQFEAKHILVNLLSKSLLLKLYYEQDELDALESLLDSFSIYLRRKEIVGSHKANYQNIVKYTRKLLRLSPYDKEKRALLRKEIVDASPLAERPWLLEQIDKL